MNAYFLGMCISMAVYILIGIVVGRKVRGVEDYYVAGRRAPVLLVAGSLIASYTSTGMFMGDAAQCYDGVFTSVLMFAGMQSAGYIVGAVFFGRYMRRSRALTIPEFLGKRFTSNGVKYLAAITAVVMMSVYLLSVMQGIGTLMHEVTGVPYAACIMMALVVFTFITVFSGSGGVLITDTLMAALFTGAVVISALVIAGKAGGWTGAVRTIASSPDMRDILSWGGRSGPLYATGLENVLWGLIYGVVWMSICMVGPWQSSRYLMAKDEHTVIRSAVPAALGVFLLEFLVGMSAVFINVVNPGLTDSSKVMIWGAMNLLPKVLGVILLTGVLAAGISSATTFLSLIGSSVANDLAGNTKMNHIFTGRITMVTVSLVVLLLAVFNPPSVFWIMQMGGSIVSSSWMPVIVGAVFSKRLTKAGAFSGMLAGFLACFGLRLYMNLAHATLPVYLDPSFTGIVCNVVVMTIVTALTRVTPAENKARQALFVMPESEKDPREMRKTLQMTKWSALTGVIVCVMLLLLWVIPYTAAK